MGGHAITPQAAREAVKLSAQMTYAQACEHLRQSHGIWIAKEPLERLTRTVGQYWLEQDRQVALQAIESHKSVASEQTAQQCLIFADGVMVHTDGAWHEARVGTVRVQGVDQKIHKSSIARLCPLEEFGQDLWRKACQMGYGGASVRAFIADGSHWLWNLAQSRFSAAIQIVDFWHACQHIVQCSDAFLGEGTDEARRWSLEVCGTLRAGLVEDALKTVEKLPGRSKARREAKHQLITYLTNNRGRMDYPRYERLGLPIGSGEVEAQCKTLVQSRCKQAGMRWSTAGIEQLLRVRCAVKDESYDKHFGNWMGNLAAWQLRRKPLHRKAA